MGLDMYLMSKRVGENGEPYTEDVAYWRKANQIHNWFNVNCAGGVIEDCEEVPVSRENIEALLEICVKVLNMPSKGSKLLPNVTGFFFGSQEYDEYYIEDVKHTAYICKKLLDTFDWENSELVYYAWW